jgi:hypothetical protein
MRLFQNPGFEIVVVLRFYAIAAPVFEKNRNGSVL